MKKTPKQFAIALYEAAKGKKGKELEEAIFNFAEILRKENKLKWQDKIITALEKHARREQGIEEIEIQSAHALDATAIKKIKKYLIETEPKLKQAEKIIVVKKTDPRLLGGLVLKFEDQIWDMSLKKQLHLLKTKLASA